MYASNKDIQILCVCKGRTNKTVKIKSFKISQFTGAANVTRYHESLLSF